MLNEMTLEKLYVDKNLSQRDIAKKLGVPRETVRHNLHKYGISKPRSSIVASMKGTLFKTGNSINLGRERPDMLGNKLAAGRFEEAHSQWRGDDVGYGGVHGWIRSRYGNANQCSLHPEHKAKRYEWANISGKYLRDIKDYLQLCPSCHRKYDAGDIRRSVIVACRERQTYRKVHQ